MSTLLDEIVSARRGGHIDAAKFGLFEKTRPLRPRHMPHFGQAFPGFGAHGKCLSAAPFVSLLERDARTLFDADADVRHYAVSPHRLNFELPEVLKPLQVPSRRWGNDLPNGVYTPDLVVRFGRISEDPSTIIVVEVRAHGLRCRENWAKWEPIIRDAYAKHCGVDFVVLDERTIRREPRLRNCRLLNRYRWHIGSRDAVAAELMRIAILRLTGETTIDDLIASNPIEGDHNGDRAYRAIMNHILDGELLIDHAVPLDRRSIVRRRIAS